MNPTQFIKEIQVKELVEKKSKKGQDFMVVKDQDGKSYYAWEGVHFSLLRAVKQSGEKVKCTIEDGKYPSIKGMDGVEIPVAQVGNRGGANFAARDAKIETNIVRKENSIVEAAIRRDAAMFSVETWKEFGGDKETDMIKKALDYWTEYFRARYN